MSKKIVSIIFVCLIFLLLASCGKTTETKEESNSPYSKVIKSAIKCTDDLIKEYGKDSAYAANGFTYDFDGDNQEELVMMYWKNSSDSEIKCLSVYTIKNGKVKELIKDKVLANSDNGPMAHENGDAGIVVDNNKEYLMAFHVSGIESCNTKCEFYKISSSKAKLVKTSTQDISYNFDTKKSDLKNVIAGKKVSYSKYMDWQKSLKVKMLKKGKSVFDKYKYYFYTSTADSLNKLLK